MTDKPSSASQPAPAAEPDPAAADEAADDTLVLTAPPAGRPCRGDPGRDSAGDRCQGRRSAERDGRPLRRRRDLPRPPRSRLPEEGRRHPHDGRRGHPGVRLRRPTRCSRSRSRRWTQGGLTEASTVSRSLLDLRHTVEDLDPAHQGDLFSPKKLLGVLPFGAGDRVRGYFDKYRSSQTPPQQDHRVPVLGPGRAAARQCGHRRRAAAAVGGQRPAAPVHLHGPAARREAGRAHRGGRGDRPRAGDRAQAGPPVLRPPEGAGPRRPSWRSASRATSRSTSCARTTSS